MLYQIVLRRYENCKRKGIQNNNNRRITLNDINEADYINFQRGNKIEKLKLLFAEVSSSSSESLNRGSIQRKLEEISQYIFLRLWICDCKSFQKLLFQNGVFSMLIRRSKSWS